MNDNQRARTGLELKISSYIRFSDNKDPYRAACLDIIITHTNTIPDMHHLLLEFLLYSAEYLFGLKGSPNVRRKISHQFERHLGLFHLAPMIEDLSTSRYTPEYYSFRVQFSK